MYSDIVILNGSPKKSQGNTAFLSQFLINGFRDSGRKVQEVFLYDLKPNFCKGCHSCWKTGICDFNDDISELVFNIMKSKLIIWATPLYFCTMTAYSKMVLERFSPFISPLIEKGPINQDQHYKSGIPPFGLFSTCFYPDAKHFDNLCCLFKDICANMNVNYSFELCIPAAPHLINLKDKHDNYFKAIYEIGKFYGINDYISESLRDKVSERIVDDTIAFNEHNKLFL